MSNYSFLDLACDVLKQAAQPMTYQEIWQAGCDKGLASKMDISGKTPAQTLGARLYVEVRDNTSSQFIPVGKRSEYDTVVKDIAQYVTTKLKA